MRRAFRLASEKQRAREWFLENVKEIVHQLRGQSKEQFRDLIHAVNALRRWEDDHGSAEDFCRFLKADRLEIRLAATAVMRALVKDLGTPDGLSEQFRPYVFEGLKDPDPRIRKLLVQAIAWFTASNNPHNQEAFAATVALLEDPVVEVRLLAAHTLRLFVAPEHPRHQEAFKVAVGLLEDSIPEIRELAVHSLRWFAATNHPHHGEAFEITVGLLKLEDANVRTAAISIMPAFGPDRVSSAVDEIRKALSDVNPNIRQQLCDLLGWLGVDARQAFDRLLVLAAEDPERSVRVAAATAIMRAVSVLQKIDPEGTHIDIGPAESQLRLGLISSLREAGPIGRKLRRELERSSSDRVDEPPPGLVGIWHEFTPTERNLLRAIYRLRRDGRARGDAIIENMGWGDAKDPSSLLRRHLTAVRKKLVTIGLKLPMDGVGHVLWC